MAEPTLREVVEAKAAELGYRPGELIDDFMQIAEVTVAFSWGMCERAFRPAVTGYSRKRQR